MLAAISIIVGLAIGLIVGGLVICLLSNQAKSLVLTAIFWWAGITLAVVGLILLIVPALNWLYTQLRTIIGE